MVSKFLVKEEEEGGGLELQLGGGVRRVHVRKRGWKHVRSGGMW